MIAVIKFLAVALYVVACGVLIFAVLLQQGKGASLGASLGGGAGQTVFGSRTGTLISRLTAVMAGVFMVLALLLAKWPPFGTDTSSDVESILMPEVVEETVPEPAAGVSDALGGAPETPAESAATAEESAAGDLMPDSAEPAEALTDAAAEAAAAAAETEVPPANVSEGASAPAEATAPLTDTPETAAVPASEAPAEP